MRKRSLLVAVVCGAMGLALVACVPEVPERHYEEGSEIEATLKGNNGPQSLSSIYEEMDERAEEYAPKVITLEDGTQIQRTPDSDGDSVFAGAPSAYNTASLNADNRGCDSCHQDGLADLVRNMQYKHFDLETGLGTSIGVQDCLMCHNDSSWLQHGLTKQFGSLIHGIHSRDTFKGDCMSCHSATADGQGMALWDIAKYDVLSGILSVENVGGNFSYDQDKLGGSLGLTWWPMGDSELDGLLNDAFEEKSLNTELFENWEISISGMVDKPFSITLGELIEQAPSETFISSEQCILNPPAGEFLANAEVTAVPLSWLLEKAGVQEGATTIMPFGADTYTGYPNTLDNIASEGGWLVYKVNGEPLSYLDGYPCRVWFPDHSFPMSVRWVNEIVIGNDDLHWNEGFGIAGVFGGAGSWIGDDESSAEFANKPNVAICNTYEGQIVPVGTPYKFEGYADAINEQVTAVEFSMDGGATWTRFDTSDSDKKKWVYWTFEYTPEEAGAYVLNVRAVSGDGRVSYRPDRIMINAK